MKNSGLPEVWHKLQSRKWWLTRLCMRKKISESNYHTFEVYLFVWSLLLRIYFIICTLMLVFMLKEWKLLAASQIKREYSSIHFQPIWFWSLGSIKIICDCNVCLHWSNIPVNENQPNLTGENKNVQSLVL